MKIIGLMFLSLFSSQAFAATWVGNGGHSRDTSIYNARKNLGFALEQSYDKGTYCTCPAEAPPSSYCERLKMLSSAEKGTCKSYFYSHFPALQKAIHNFSKIRVEPVSEPLTLNNRSVEAIAQYDQGRIVIHEAALTKLKQEELIGLLAHEFGHMIPFYKVEEPIADDDSYEAFEGSDGGRRLLDTLAATAAVQWMTETHLPAPWRRDLWFSLNLGQKISSGNIWADNFLNKSSFMASARVLKMWERFGLSANIEKSDSDKKSYGELESKYNSVVAGLGLHYQWQPWADIRERLSWTHFNFGIGYDIGTVEFEMNDTFVELSDKTTTHGPWAQLEMRIPFFNIDNLWITTSGKIHYEFYKEKILDSNQTEILSTSFVLGASYAL